MHCACLQVNYRYHPSLLLLACVAGQPNCHAHFLVHFPVQHLKESGYAQDSGYIPAYQQRAIHLNAGTDPFGQVAQPDLRACLTGHCCQA